MQSAMRTEFLGASLKSSTAMKAAPAARPVTVQAFFKKSEKAASAPAKATKVLKKEIKKAAPVVKEAKKSLFAGFKKAEKKAAPVAKAVEKKASGFSNPFKRGPAAPVSKIAASAKKAVAPVKKAAAPVKKALVSFKKAAAPAKRAGGTSVVRKAGGTKRTGGWLGGAGGPSNLDQWYGPSRALFLPGGLLTPTDIPAYLNGSLAGDYGYDPLGLGKDQEQVEKYRAFELLHARWAMLAAAGILIPEGLQANGADIHGGTWFETGAEMLNGGTLNYFAVPWGVIGNPLPLVAVTAVEVVLLGAVETYRRTGSGPKGYSPGVGNFDSSIFEGLDSLYPGGPFDPLRLADDPEVLQELKVKEIKNGRLAMISVLAFAVQSYVTGEGPYANWIKHINDPFGYNLLTIIGNEDRVPTL